MTDNNDHDNHHHEHHHNHNNDDDEKHLDDHDNNEENDDDNSITLSEALCEMLGLPYTKDKDTIMNTNHNGDVDDDNNIEKHLYPCYQNTIKELMECFHKNQTLLSDILLQNNHHDQEKKSEEDKLPKQYYNMNTICYQLPNELSIHSTLIRQITNELIYNEIYINNPNIIRSYETITKYNTITYQITYQSVLTRIEHICPYHNDWYTLCNDYIPSILSILLNDSQHGSWHLYKEKLNIKPAGGNGYAPHVDTPSLRNIILSPPMTTKMKDKNSTRNDTDVEGHHDDDVGVDHDDSSASVTTTSLPTHFITVMIAIDDMTIENGCLQVDDNEKWNEDTISPYLIPPKLSVVDGGNPDSDGRVGALIDNEDDVFHYNDMICKSGTIFIFHGYIPHRSNPNQTHFSRRAIFLTYYYNDNDTNNNSINYYDYYYKQMNILRTTYRHNHHDDDEHQKSSQSPSPIQLDPLEYAALATIPKI